MSKENKKNEEIIEAQVEEMEPETDETPEDNSENVPAPTVKVEVKKNFLEKHVDACYQKRVDRAQKRAQKQAEKAAAKTEETEKIPVGLKIAVGVAATGAVIKTGFRIWDAVNSARNHSDETAEGSEYEETSVEEGNTEPEMTSEEN